MNGVLDATANLINRSPVQHADLEVAGCLYEPAANCGGRGLTCLADDNNAGSSPLLAVLVWAVQRPQGRNFLPLYFKFSCSYLVSFGSM